MFHLPYIVPFHDFSWLRVSCNNTSNLCISDWKTLKWLKFPCQTRFQWTTPESPLLWYHDVYCGVPSVWDLLQSQGPGLSPRLLCINPATVTSASFRFMKKITATKLPVKPLQCRIHLCHTCGLRCDTARKELKYLHTMWHFQSQDDIPTESTLPWT